MTLETALTWLSGVGAGVVATFLLRQLDEASWWFRDLRPDHKRYLAFVATALVACVAYLVLVLLAYQLRPADAKAWAEALFAVAASSITAGQLAHSAMDLRKR